MTEPDIQPSQHGIPPPEFHSFNINEKESSKNSQNFSFQEYIRLKRENLSLRVLVSLIIYTLTYFFLQNKVLIISIVG